MTISAGEAERAAEPDEEGAEVMGAPFLDLSGL